MESLAELLEDACGQFVEVIAEEPVAGGCIHDSRKIRTSAGVYFVKQSSLSKADMLTTEAKGLAAIADTKSVRTPCVIAFGKAGNRFALILEWIELHPVTSESGESLGIQLAELHSHRASRYGWHCDNFIGSSPQENEWSDSWPQFFRDQRIRPQLRLAKENRYSLPSPEPFIDDLESLFPDGDIPHPSPLHGDLWSGNALSDESGNPVLFDPAFYYGDPEADIAFTRFFGGFPETFYQSYFDQIPRRPGWKIRETLYNLYHVLNHLNLFGPGYLTTARRMITDLNRAVDA